MLHRNGTGPVSQTVLFELPAGVSAGVACAFLEVQLANGNVIVDFDNGDSPANLGGSGGERFAILPLRPGRQVKYTVIQDPGQTVVWSFDLTIGAPSDFAVD